MTNQPSHKIFVVKKAKPEGGKDRWVKVGAMWPNKKGFTIELELVPTNFDGRLVGLESQSSWSNNFSN